MAEPRGGMVRLDPSRGSTLTLLLNKEPDRGGGVGGWQAADRATRRPAKWWKGIPDDTLSLDCTLDLHATGGPDIERRLRVLRDMGQPQGTADPPTIQVSGDVWDADKTITWVMTNLTLGARLYMGDGSLRRQQVTVELERWNELADISPIALKRTRTAKGRRKRRTVVSRAHDTLRTVALRELSDARRWKDLQRWNKKLKGADPDIQLRTGTHIVIR